MVDRLDQLKQEVVVDLLRDWIDVYDKGQVIYDSYPEEIRAWVDEHGHRVESFVSVVANMQPDVRVVCRSLVEDALAATLSQGERTIDPSDERGGNVEREDKAEPDVLAWCQSIDERLARLEQVILAIGTVAQSVDRTQDR